VEYDEEHPMSKREQLPIYQTRSTRVLEPRSSARGRRGRQMALAAAGLLALIVVAALLGQGLRVAAQPGAPAADAEAARERVLGELSAATTPAPAAPTGAPAPAGATVAGTDGAGLNLRADPGLAGALLATLPEGSPVAPTGQTRSADGILWAEVGAGDVTGWAAADYLQGS
jgi:hypothetical protein